MKRLTSLFGLGGLALALALPAPAQAGGLYLTDRGSRQLGRGGAFVAGADDGQSLWYNPAGLSYAGRKHLHVDGTLSLFRARFYRVTRDTENPPQPKVEADPTLLPIPTLAYTDDFGLKDWAFGAAIMAPNAVMLAWPETVNGKPGPTRHSLISMEGSAIANIALGASWRGVKGLSIGAGVHVIPARFRAGVYLSSYTGAVEEHPESPDSEAPAIVDLERAITATGILGVIYEWNMFRIGASMMLPYNISGEAKLDAELPNNRLFGDNCGNKEERKMRSDCAQIEGNRADVTLKMPMVARLGAEIRPMTTLRVEADVVYEGWSRQKEMRVEPKNIRIVNAEGGLTSYDVGDIAVRRDMQDVFSLRLGTEYRLSETSPLQVRAGVIFENSAFPDQTLTPLTLDAQKWVLGLGASYELREKMWIDVLYAHIFMDDPKVRTSRVYPQNPLRPELPPPKPGEDPLLGQPEPIGNGNYTMEADVIGLGLRVNL